ncbi:RNA-binding domain-containing protein, partial [Dendrothele bispora CBS 962.96]
AVNRREVISLFDTLIGEIRSSTDFRDAIGTHIEITFASNDAAKKALCMSGYTIGGCSLNVTPVIDVEESSAKRLDMRRNLYVLGIPFDLSKSEFSAIFSRYGKVAHCVILATVDNASRRRGFVVMSNHEEAKRAMMALTRTQIKGHTIDISWSIVQRSEGFLDGGDRSMLFDASFADGVPSPHSQDGNQVETPLEPPAPLRPSNHAFTLTFTPSNTILVTNLPFILFSSTSDLEPLLRPFGKVSKLEMIALPSPQETTSALVEYTTLEEAKEAKEHLQGQCYASYRVNAEYV